MYRGASWQCLSLATVVRTVRTRMKVNMASEKTPHPGSAPLLSRRTVQPPKKVLLVYNFSGKTAYSEQSLINHAQTSALQFCQHAPY